MQQPGNATNRSEVIRRERKSRRTVCGHYKSSASRTDNKAAYNKDEKTAVKYTSNRPGTGITEITNDSASKTRAVIAKGISASKSP